MLRGSRVVPLIALVWVAVSLQWPECRGRPVLHTVADSTKPAATEGSASKPSVSITEKNSTKFDAMESSQSRLSEENDSSSKASLSRSNFTTSTGDGSASKPRKLELNSTELNGENELAVNHEGVARSINSKGSDQPKRLARNALRKEARKKKTKRPKKASTADGAASLEIVQEDTKRRDLNPKQPSTPRKKKKVQVQSSKPAKKVVTEIPKKKDPVSSKTSGKKKVAVTQRKNEGNRKPVKETKKPTKKKRSTNIEDDRGDNTETNNEENQQIEEDSQSLDYGDTEEAVNSVESSSPKTVRVSEAKVKLKEKEPEVEEENDDSLDFVDEDEEFDDYEPGSEQGNEEEEEIEEEEEEEEESAATEEIEADYEYEEIPSTEEDPYPEVEENQAHAADVELPPTNQRTRFSNNKPESADVTPKPTNEKPLLIEHSGDVPRSLRGVGGKSMNENLHAMFGPGYPPKVSVLGKCNLEDITLKVECRGNMISICGGRSAQRPVRVWVEGGEGSAELTRKTPRAFAELHAADPNTTAAPRWVVAHQVDKEAASAECQDPAHISPVLIVKASKNACRMLLNCTCRLDEAFVNLGDGGDEASACDDQPMLYTSMSLHGVDGSEIAGPVTLGKPLRLQVEAEAALLRSAVARRRSAVARRLRRDQRTEVDLHLQKCWVGRPGLQRALLVQDGCSMVEILQNFVEKHDTNYKIMQVYDSYIVNPGERKQYEPEKSALNSTDKENETLTQTFLNTNNRSSRVVQSSSFIAFIMDVTDTVIDITCEVKICVDECLEAPTCVDSSVNVDRGQGARLPPVYSITRSLTVSMTPNTNMSGSSRTNDQVRKERAVRSSGDDLSPNSTTENTKQLTSETPASSESPVENPQVGGFVQVKPKDEKASEFNKSRSGPWISYSDPNLVDPHSESTNCVPWWLFFLSLSLLTITYIVALIGCVYYLSNETQKQGRNTEEIAQTPTRPYYIDQCSARKRSPPSFTERYLY